MEVNQIAVIGSGTMGRGIAYTAALAGFDVTLQDIQQKQSIMQKTITESLANKSVEKGYIQVNKVTLYNKIYLYNRFERSCGKCRFSD